MKNKLNYLINMVLYHLVLIRITIIARFYFLFLLLLSIKKFINIIYSIISVRLYRNMSIVDQNLKKICIQLEIYRYLPLMLVRFLWLLLEIRKKEYKKCYFIFMDAMGCHPELLMTMLILLHWRKDGPLHMLI